MLVILPLIAAGPIFLKGIFCKTLSTCAFNTKFAIIAIVNKNLFCITSKLTKIWHNVI
jgi:hypothetical protein